ncbi:hypothetical protein K3Z96_23195, partial [Pseudomonas aeruginosa]|nr:hypothetical protein [Pseudomonas aeruginosa]
MRTSLLVAALGLALAAALPGKLVQALKEVEV